MRKVPVKMRVDVDETRGDNHSSCVQCSCSGQGLTRSHCGDSAGRDADVGTEAWPATPVYYETIVNYLIVGFGDKNKFLESLKYAFDFDDETDHEKLLGWQDEIFSRHYL